MLGWLLKILPRNHLSYFVGKLVHIPLPKPLSSWSIYLFGNFYKINFSEAERPYQEYESIGAFFTRRLRAGVRPISMARVTHPADSRISQLGSIQEGSLIQAKGKTYRVSDLTKSLEAEKYYFNGFFTTYYLCPMDYHRVHSPVEGKILSATYIPGTLWPVNEWSVNTIANLFSVNERVIVEIECPQGVVSVIFVGATNVGKITMSFEPNLVTNNLQNREIRKIKYAQPLPITHGEELGIFHMGSTIVMLYPQAMTPLAEDWHAWLGQAVKMGEAFSKP